MTRLSKQSKLLTSRQRLFCVNLASGMSQAQAYIRAGYSDIAADSNASILMKENKNVQAYYKHLVECRDKEAIARIAEQIMQPHERKVKLSSIARANLVDFQDEEGEPKLNRNIPHHEAAKEHYHRTRYDKDGNPTITKDIKLTDPIEAIRELNRMDHVYSDINASMVNVDKQVNIFVVDKESKDLLDKVAERLVGK